jgi:hypothetical protein
MPQTSAGNLRTAVHAATKNESSAIGLQFVFPKNLTTLVPFNLLTLQRGPHTGRLLHFGNVNAKFTELVAAGRYYWNWELPIGANYCMRSDTRGTSWLPPVNLDGSGTYPVAGSNAVQFHKGRGDEVSAAQVLGGPREGDVVAYIRPEAEPFVWETRSTDSVRAIGVASRCCL